jgi:tRNA(fMet)-specific endonuclease VapC
LVLELLFYLSLFPDYYNFRFFGVLDFDEKSAKVFQQLKAQKIRVGTMDLKIASIAIANEAILISRNLKDFDKIPNLSVQDWTD